MSLSRRRRIGLSEPYLLRIMIPPLLTPREPKRSKKKRIAIVIILLSLTVAVIAFLLREVALP
ncbi:MAG: hypothetical protein HY619_06290 [Thaumarchaeota archaeon]|nr:hypothetical protein [Nitrososphaerota archaeon]